MTEFVNITKVNVALDYVPVDVCNRISIKLNSIDSQNSGNEFNLWEATAGDPDFELLKQALKDTATTLVRTDSNTVTSVDVGRAWPVGYRDWEAHAPHHHGSSFVVGVAYIDVSEDSGDLLIQDPLAAYDWINRLDKRTTGSCRASVPITPITGMVLAMPGYLVHSTEPKPAGKRRLVIATNFFPTE